MLAIAPAPDVSSALMVSRRSILKALAVPAVLGVVPRPSRAAGQTVGRHMRIIVFDVNETLLDVAALELHFARAFGDRLVLREWFSTVLLYSEVVSLAGPYSDFGAIGGAALDMTAASRGMSLSADDRNRILTGMRSLPAHPDVRPGLQRLKGAGFRMVTLTNSAPAAVQQQLSNAGLTDLFERVFSVDSVRRFKPAPDPYRFVAKALGVETSALRMVAAHAWDVIGAMQVGCAAAFVARPGKVLYPLAPAPDIVGPDLRAIAEQITAHDSPR
jgi:2-haloacid dehalogenase